jgi:hypothetical protein
MFKQSKKSSFFSSAISCQINDLDLGANSLTSRAIDKYQRRTTPYRFEFAVVDESTLSERHKIVTDFEILNFVAHLEFGPIVWNVKS